ncbi:MAG: hypothetical protein JW703_04350 [Candidatus Diapherotrites archaeon]|nr:hypothetical protein [Candidatus Diapherotrites archaeon]
MFSRGQEAAVFELLIAVILMGFVILVGMNALDSLNKQKCEGELNQQLNSLKHAIEIASAGKSRQDIVLEFPSCFPSSKSVLKIKNSNQEFECTSVCKEKRNNCKILDFKSYETAFNKELAENDPTALPKYTIYSNRVCLDINPVTDFSSGDECADDKPKKFISGSWTEEDFIEPGRYLLVNASDFFASSPKVCVYEYDPNASDS